MLSMVLERNNAASHMPIPGQTDRMRLDLCIPPDSGEVPGARRAVQQVCRDVGIPEDEAAALDLALGEALANAVVHSASTNTRGKHACEVHVSAWDFQSQLVVEVRDSGCGFEPPPPPYDMPSPDADATHGRGLPMMELLTDALVVCRGDAGEGGSSVYLVKTKPGA